MVVWWCGKGANRSGTGGIAASASDFPAGAAVDVDVVAAAGGDAAADHAVGDPVAAGVGALVGVADDSDGRYCPFLRHYHPGDALLLHPKCDPARRPASPFRTAA